MTTWREASASLPLFTFFFHCQASMRVRAIIAPLRGCDAWPLTSKNEPAVSALKRADAGSWWWMGVMRMVLIMLHVEH